jgi:hypothetical protein
MEQIKKTGKARSELATNIGFQGSLVRALIHFDIIKWAWLRWKKNPEPNMNETWDEE